jgi:hypothetical protein
MESAESRHRTGEKRATVVRERPYKRDLIGTRPWIRIIVYIFARRANVGGASHRLTTVKASGTWHGNLSMFNSRYPSFHLLPVSSRCCLFAFHFCGGDCINRPIETTSLDHRAKCDAGRREKRGRARVFKRFKNHWKRRDRIIVSPPKKLLLDPLGKSRRVVADHQAMP